MPSAECRARYVRMTFRTDIGRDPSSVSFSRPDLPTLPCFLLCFVDSGPGTRWQEKGTGRQGSGSNFSVAKSAERDESLDLKCYR